MKKINKKFYFILIIFLGVIASLGYFVIKPGIENLIENNQQIDQLKTEINNENNKKMNVDNIRRSIEELHEQSSITLALLPFSKDIPTFLKNFESLVKKESCSLVSIKIIKSEGKPTISQAQKDGQFYRIDLEATINGGLVGIIKLFEGMEDFSRFIKIGNWTIEKKSGFYTVKPSFSIYFKPESN